MHDNVKIMKDQRKKPSVHKMYDHTKGGVDVVVFWQKHIQHEQNLEGGPWMHWCLSLTLVAQTQEPFWKITVSN